MENIDKKGFDKIFNKRFNENLEILKEKHPLLFEKIRDRIDKIKVTRTKNGLITFKHRGVFIESRFNPESRYIGYNKEIDLSNKEGDKLFIFFGSGLSYHINKILSNKNISAIVIEKEIDIFLASLYVLEPNVLKRIFLIIDEDYHSTIEYLENLKYEKFKIVRHPVSVKFNTNYYANVAKYIIQGKKEEVASSVTTKVQKELWRRNVLRNILNIKSPKFFPTLHLKERFDSPVILLASGPSVDNISDLLIKLAKNIPLISLLPSYSLLKSLKIRPYALFTTDPGFWNKERFLPDVDVPLFTTFSVNPIIPKNWGGRVFYFNHGLDIEKNFPEITNKTFAIPMQGTGSLVMILLARLLGFNPIFLAGYDFCGIGMKDHHRGAGFDRYFILKSNRIKNWYTNIVQRYIDDRAERIPGLNNLYTTYKLMLYKSWLEKWVKGKDLFCISNTWPINGVEQIGSEAIIRYIKNSEKTQDAFNFVLEDADITPIVEVINSEERTNNIVKRARKMLINIKNSG